MKIDWTSKLQYLLQTLAFCLAVSALQAAFMPERPYEIPLVYSVCIGTVTWALIDFGRHTLASSAETGWPQGLGGLLLPALGITGGYFLGTLAADQYFGWSSWDAAGRGQLRLSILVTALAGVAGTYYFYSRNKSAYLQTRMAQARRHANEARLKLLETQLEPHMLFNTLANLRVLIGLDPVRAVDMLDRLNEYLRATLGGSRAVLHPLDAEFSRLHDYLALMAVRMGPRLAYTLDLPEDLRSQSVPPLLLQPLVENSIKHGLEPRVEGGTIRVSAARAGMMVQIDVSDTGADRLGAPPVAQAGNSGFGLAQVRERLASTYGPRASLRIETMAAGGTRVRVRFPMEANAQP